MKKEINSIIQNEGTKRALILALGIKDDYPYSSNDFHEYDLLINNDSARICLETLVKIGIANLVRGNYILNANAEKKKSLIDYLEERNIKIPKVQAKPIFVESHVRLLLTKYEQEVK